MQGIAVTLLTEDRERLPVLQHSLDGTGMGRSVFSAVGFPASPTDPLLRQVQDVHAEVVLVDIDAQNPQRAIAAIELIQASTSNIAVFAVGEMNQPATIVAAMRAGAGEFLERSATPEALIEAFTRFTTSRGKNRTSSGRARIFTIMNSKGGSGATTVAVNTAIALQEAQGGVLLVDFAPLGHCALHLNVQPAFGVVDALQNLHRLDASLLEGLMTQCKGGLQLLAGPQQPQGMTPSVTELARLFDLLVAHFRYIVVDCSGRVDQTARLLCDLSNAILVVAHSDVVSLWSAGRIRAFLEEGAARERVRIILNRYKKIPGFDDADVEKATSCKLLWKVPNNFQSIAPAIDKGVPVALQENTEIGRCFRALAATLAQASPAAEGSLDLAYHGKADSASKTAGGLVVSPLRGASS